MNLPEEDRVMHLPAAARGARAALRSEDGGATIFTLFLLVVLLLVTGYAIDVTRFENNRTRLQATLDRAVLAAASLGQSRDCEDVIRDYFEKADLEDEIGSIDCDIDANGRTASATAGIEMETMFMQGVDRLNVPASGEANESRMDIEIVLVLDHTSSMTGAKIANLRSATQAFVDTVLENDTENRVSIAIVPYNSDVKLGPWLLNALPGVTAKHGIVQPPRKGQVPPTCIDLPASAWNDPAVNIGSALPQQPIVRVSAPNRTVESVDYVAPMRPDSRTDLSCDSSAPASWQSIILPSQDVSGLKEQVGRFQAQGATSIYLGMKWGTTLLDPVMRPIYTQAISEGRMPATLAGRPYDYDRERTMKVIVLMTDGHHFPSRYAVQGYHSGPSPIYRGEDGQLAIHHPSFAGSTNKFYVPHLSAPGITVSGWQPTASWPGSGVVTQLDWVDVWRDYMGAWVIWQLYARPLSGTDPARYAWRASKQIDAMFPGRGTALMDAQLLKNCAQVKDRGVIVFSVAFEAPDFGEELLRTCASSPAQYYAPIGGEINDSFDSIANAINVLRLTQ